MAFGTEVKDFVDAFQVGTQIQDRRRQRAIDETEAENRLTIAKDKNALESRKFNVTTELNRDKLKAQIDRWGDLSQDAKAKVAAQVSHWNTLHKDAQDRIQIDRDKAKDISARGIAAQKSLDAYRADTGKRAAETAAENKRQFNVSEARLGEGAKENRRQFEVTEGRLGKAANIAARKAAIEEDPTAILDEPTSALPTGVTSGVKSDSSMGGVSTKPATKTSPVVGGGMGPAALPMALAGGLKYLQDHFGLSGGLGNATTGQKDGARRMFEGEGSWTPEEQDAVDSVLDEEDIKNGVDPKDIDKRLRTVNRLTRTYEMWNKKNQPEKANQAAAGIIQTSRGTAAILGASAIKKLQTGDVTGAAKDLVQAHDQIPDGQAVQYDEKTQRFIISDEESGKVLQEGQVTPDMIFSLANGFKDGSAFYKIIMDSAGRDKSMQDKETPEQKRTAKEEAAGKLTPMSPADADTLKTATTETIRTELASATGEDGAPLFANPEQMEAAIGSNTIDSISQLAGMISQYNGVEAGQASKLALMIVQPDFTNTNETVWNFQLIDDRNPNVMEIVAEDGSRLRLPARLAGSAIKSAHDGLKEVLGEMHGIQNEEAIGSATRASEAEDLAREREVSARRARQGSDTRKNTAYGPAGTRARITGIPVGRMGRVR